MTNCIYCGKKIKFFQRSKKITFLDLAKKKNKRGCCGTVAGIIHKRCENDKMS